MNPQQGSGGRMNPQQGSGSSMQIVGNNQAGTISSYAPLPNGDNGSGGLLRPWLIREKEIQLETKLGGGAFGIVYKGKWRNQDVAVKKMLGTFSKQQFEAFLAEAEIMSKLRPHENVIQFLGVSNSNPPAIVTKYYELGSLLQYKVVEEATMIGVLKGIAAGVAHLHAENIIHRDLAARNILLQSKGSQLLAVVADFGFARTMEDEQHKSAMEVGPVRWMSPESLDTRIYSVKSDAWGFGVLIWELLTQKLPWADLDNVNAIVTILSKKKLEIPPNCRPSLRILIQQCWDLNPSRRPSFQKIFNTLANIELEL